jgi:DNA repair protein RecO (recombination protein O)
MPLLKTPAITLKSRKWGDADRIVTFYTLRFGKLRGVARGARRMKSRFGSALEPFVHCDLNLFEKGNDPLYRITQADIRESFSALREDLTLMSGAARLANLVAAVTGEGDPGPRIFETLLGGIQGGSAHDIRAPLSRPGPAVLPKDSLVPALTTLLFQIRLLGQTGFRPQTEHCVACGGRPENGRGERFFAFSPVSGGIVCETCASRYPDRCLPLSPGSLALLKPTSRSSPASACHRSIFLRQRVRNRPMNCDDNDTILVHVFKAAI